MSDKVLIKTSKLINNNKEKVSVISHRYNDVSAGFEVDKSSIPVRQDIDTHKAELFIYPIYF